MDVENERTDAPIDGVMVCSITSNHSDTLSQIKMKDPGSATLALHADDPLNLVPDVAPPLHLSTTYRYSDNPKDLAAHADAPVGSHEI